MRNIIMTIIMAAITGCSATNPTPFLCKQDGTEATTIDGRCVPACPELSIVPGDSAVSGTSNSVVTAKTTASSQSVEIVALPTKSAISIQPNATATLTATGEWSVSLRVPNVSCAEQTKIVTVGCLAGFDDVNGQCFCPAGSDNDGGKCVAKTSLCAKAKPQFSLEASNATGANATLRVSFSSDLYANATVELVAVPQNTTVKVPPFLPASAGSAVLPSTGSWNI
jgi:hypothetical protein